ncbi:MAG: PC4/YdbC family ssDNA-binding protein [Clostridiales bacterium]|nr:PC4/YdbC family ssDNA-binding protein [Clostridiales bacterium]
MAVNEKDQITFEIVEHVGVISTHPTGWKKELNIVAWNGGNEKYDLRDWDPNHEHMSRGITLHKDEAKKLFELLKERKL